MKKLKIIISGGGTGGHIFPAISIANELRDIDPNCEILFVGAEGRMEMERVPAAGYDIVGLPIFGFPRKPGIKTFTFFINLARSLQRARRVVKQFNPQVVIGVGGYASGPILRVAAAMKIPTLIQEQNSYAGITNRLLAKKVDKICVAYDKMDSYFPAGKIVYTGNPVRKNLLAVENLKEEAKAFFHLNSGKRIILVVGGSLGARTLNKSLLANIGLLQQADVEVIWQTGKIYFEDIATKMKSANCPNVKVFEFLSRMDLAYAAADLVISRAGAGTISELCLMKKPTILVPSPNVAEDHQTKNALALVESHAAIMVTDVDAEQKLIPLALDLITKNEELEKLGENIGKLAKPNAAKTIAEIVLELVKNK